ncbi:MAG: tetratricopeptide repeat protein [Rhodothermales bacterium]
MRFALYILPLSLSLALLPATTPDTFAQIADAVRHFDEGNQQYLQGAYQDALAAYEEALNSGYTSGALFYNMGNAYYRLDELGQAIRYYEKARRFLPNDPQLLHNLDIARSRIEAPVSALPTPFWLAFWKRYVVHTGAAVFFIVGLFFYGIAAVLIGHRTWTGTRNPWHRRALSLSLLLGILLLVTAFAASLDHTLDRQAVVVVDQIPLREAPQEDASSELNVHEGILLDVLGQQEGWLEVRLPNGVTGWIEAGAAGDV